MTLGEWLAFGFDRHNILCVGVHVHRHSFAVDFFGFYLNVGWD